MQEKFYMQMGRPWQDAELVCVDLDDMEMTKEERIKQARNFADWIYDNVTSGFFNPFLHQLKARDEAPVKL